MKCPSCGAEIGNDKFCQYCGSQVTMEMKKEQEYVNKDGCPKCGSSNVSFSREKQGEVLGNAGSAVVHATVGVCHDCGYTWSTAGQAFNTNNKSMSDNTVLNQKPVKKRRTWLWVLGWIFIFPLPLTLILLKKDMKPAIKYGIIAVAWIVYILIGFTGGDTSNTDVQDSDSGTVAEQSAYSEDEVVNDFINKYNAISDSDFTNITKGNIRTKYYADSYGYYVELLDAADTNKICVTISETNENADSGVAGMKDIFRDVIKTIDQNDGNDVTYSDEQIDRYFDAMIEQGYLMEDDTGLGASVTFCPDTDSSRGHIEIRVK